MEDIGLYISNLVKNQLPEHFHENGPLFVAFLVEYYKWLEQKSYKRNEFRPSTLSVTINSPNVVGRGSSFATVFANNDKIAIVKDLTTKEYDIFDIDVVSNNTFMTLKSNTVPNFTISNTQYSTVSLKPNANYLTRNYFTIKDVDETFDEYVIFFKEKYLKNIQFDTTTNTRTLIKHSLDLYRSKGTDRAIDLLYKIVFGKPANVYYPGQDLFRLSSGDWFIPKYLELSLAKNNKLFVNKQIVGAISGATAFVEEIIRRTSGTRVIEVAYISALNGSFRTGEKITLSNQKLDLDDCPSIVGSLNEIEVAVAGVGSGFVNNEIVDVTSVTGTQAKAKVVSTANSIGALTFQLIDGGYGYSTNTQLFGRPGSVSVNSSCTVVTGTSTVFERDFQVGDLVSIYMNGTSYDTRSIVSIASNTDMSVNTPFSDDNSSGIAYYTRSFAQTYVSEKILKVSNVSVNSSYNNFEYVSFFDTLTQSLAYINYTGSNGQFANGDTITTYHANNDVKGQGVVLNVTQNTLSTGILTVAVTNGDLDEPTIYTSANAVAANLTVSNGYFDISATGKVIGNYSNVTIIANSIVGSFDDNEELVQVSSGARGLITGSFLQGTNVVISVANSIGIFKDGATVTGANSSATANVQTLEIELGVYDIGNTFVTTNGNFVNTAQLTGTVTQTSNGSGANVVFGNTILYPEIISVVNDPISQHVDDELDGIWVFEVEPNANLSTVIDDALSFSNLTIGRIANLVSYGPGTGYNKSPIIRIHEPKTFSYSYHDEVRLTVSNTAGFVNGEVITQSDTDARGLIENIDSSNNVLHLQRMRFNPNSTFSVTSNATTIIEGDSSGTSANVTAVAQITSSPRIGSDTRLNYTLIIAGGAITTLKVIDSGVGFTNGEQVTITSSTNNQINATAILRTHGTGSGYYRDRSGFLSSDQKLSDGEYWQEYSYVVRSAVVDSFKNILKDIVHVAGTKYFSELVYDSINEKDVNVSTAITQA